MTKRQETEKTGADEADIYSTPRPKAYILHRTNGKGRSHPVPDGEGDDIDRKPPCFVCYIPAPVYHLAAILEQNKFCEAFGRIGSKNFNYQKRRELLLFGVAANVLSFLLSLFACLSISLKFNHIVAGGFSKGFAYIPSVDLPTSRIWIGLRGVAIRNFQGQAVINDGYVEGDQVIEFDSFCDYVDEGLPTYMDPDDCDSCAEASSGLITAVIMATVLTLPNIFTDILRMYPNYDLNCQKFFGSILNLASAISSLYAYRGYADLCFKKFYAEGQVSEVPVSDGLIESIQTIIPGFSYEGESMLEVMFKWRPGNGLICIFVATILKGIDIIIMLMIPTPDIAHKRSLQESYEVLYGGDEDSAGDEDIAAKAIASANAEKEAADYSSRELGPDE